MKRNGRGVTPRTTEPGLSAVPGPNQLRPNARDAIASRDVLAYVPTGVQMVQNFGTPSAGMHTRSIPTSVPKSDRQRVDGVNLTPGYDRAGPRKPK